MELRLTPKTRRRTIADHIERLDREIAAKRAVRRMEMALEIVLDSDPDFFQPLFIFFSAEPERVPSQLGVCWWNGQTSLTRPACLAGLPPAVCEQFPTGYVPGDACAAHVVTTAVALGEPGPPDLGLRLREYGNIRGDMRQYEILNEWATRDLRVFVPLEEHLELYPNFPVNDDTADKLAQALLGDTASGREERRDWCFLLDQRQDTKMRTILLPRDGFQPLVEAEKWKSNAEVERHRASARGEAVPEAKRLAEALHENARQDLQNAVGKLGTEWLAAESKILKALITSRVNEFRERQERQQAAFDKVNQAQESAVTQLSGIREEVEGLMRSVSDLAANAKNDLSKTKDSVERLGKLQSGVATLATEVDKLRRDYATAEAAIINARNKRES